MKKLISLALLATSAVLTLNGQIQRTQSQLLLEKDPSGQLYTLKTSITELPEAEQIKNNLKNLTADKLTTILDHAVQATRVLQMVALESDIKNANAMANRYLNDKATELKGLLEDLGTSKNFAALIKTGSELVALEGQTQLYGTEGRGGFSTVGPIGQGMTTPVTGASTRAQEKVTPGAPVTPVTGATTRAQETTTQFD